MSENDRREAHQLRVEGGVVETAGHLESQVPPLQCLGLLHHRHIDSDGNGNDYPPQGGSGAYVGMEVEVLHLVQECALRMNEQQ